MILPSWVTLHGKAHSFTELCKPLQHDKAVTHEGITVCQVINAEGMIELEIFLFCKFPSKIISLKNISKCQSDSRLLSDRVLTWFQSLTPHITC